MNLKWSTHKVHVRPWVKYIVHVEPWVKFTVHVEPWVSLHEFYWPCLEPGEDDHQKLPL